MNVVMYAIAHARYRLQHTIHVAYSSNMKVSKIFGVIAFKDSFNYFSKHIVPTSHVAIMQDQTLWY